LDSRINNNIFNVSLRGYSLTIITIWKLKNKQH